MALPVFESVTYDGYNDHVVSHTLSSNKNRYIFVAAMVWHDGNPTAQNTPTYDGNSMTGLTYYENTGGRNSGVQLWYYAVPDSDTGAKSVVGGGGDVHASHTVFIVFEFSNVDSVTNDSGDGGKTQTLAMTGIGSDSLIVSAFRAFEARAKTLDSAGTLITNGFENSVDSDYDNGWGVAYHDPSGSSFTWDWGPFSDSGAIAGLEIVGITNISVSPGVALVSFDGNIGAVDTGDLSLSPGIATISLSSSLLRVTILQRILATMIMYAQNTSSKVEIDASVKSGLKIVPSPVSEDS